MRDLCERTVVLSVCQQGFLGKLEKTQSVLSSSIVNRYVQMPGSSFPIHVKWNRQGALLCLSAARNAVEAKNADARTGVFRAAPAVCHPSQKCSVSHLQGCDGLARIVTDFACK